MCLEARYIDIDPKILHEIFPFLLLSLFDSVVLLNYPVFSCIHGPDLALCLNADASQVEVTGYASMATFTGKICTIQGYMCGEECNISISTMAKLCYYIGFLVKEDSNVWVSRAVTTQHERRSDFTSTGVAGSQDFD